MKLFGFQIYFLFFMIGKVVGSNSGSNHYIDYATECQTVINAVNEIIVDIYSIYSETLDMTTVDGSFRANDLKDQLLARAFSNLKVILRQELISELRGSLRRQSVVLLIEDFHDFYKFYRKMEPGMFKFNGIYLIVLVNGEIQELKEIFDLLWNIQVYKVLVVFEGANEIVSVATFIPFSSKKCNDTTPVMIDTFEKGKFKHNKRHLFTDKMKDLNKCQVRVTIGVNLKPSVIVEQLPNGSYNLDGGDIQILKTLSQSLNFRIDYVYIGNVGYLFDNGTSEGPLRYLLDGKADLSITGWWLKINRLKYLDATSPYITDSLVFVVPPGREWTAFEKLIFPFTLQLWLLILGCFLIGFLVIFVVKRHSRMAQNFVFGRNVRNPNFNLFIGFIGGSQNILPKRNFARFLLMIFLLYSLIIRTLYQASFYKLMQSRASEKEVQTIEEMIEKEYEFHVYKGTADLLRETAGIASRLVISNNVSAYLEDFRNDSSLPIAYGVSVYNLLYFNKNLSKNSRYKICKDVLFVYPVVVYTRKNYFLLDALSAKLETLNSAGLINFWRLQYTDEMFLSSEETIYAKSLTMHNLNGPFQVLLIGCLASLLVFICEILEAQFKKLNGSK